MPEAKHSPAYEAKNAWTIYKSDEDRAKMKAFVDGYIDFLSACKTERETVAFAEKTLRGHGFSDDPASGRYLAKLRGKCLFAFRRGTEPLSKGISLVAAHGDCPRLDWKQHPFVEQAGFAQAKTHYYGGLRKYQWLSRPLALHGVVAKKDGETIEVVIGKDPEDPKFVITDLLPHLAKDQMAKSASEFIPASSAAPAMRPSSSARARSSSTAMPPRPVFTRRADFFICRSCS